ncbi:MAG: hypothetical protein AAF629_05910 [Chloroflexota bacterium]
MPDSHDLQKIKSLPTEALYTLCYDEFPQIYGDLSKDTDRKQILAWIIGEQTIAPDIPQSQSITSKLIRGLASLMMLAAVGVGVYFMALVQPEDARPPLGRWIFVVDASSVMNERIGDKFKMGIVRDQLKVQSNLVPLNVEAGLHIYGGNKSGLEVCKDITVLVKPDLQQNERIGNSLDSVIPSGEAPLIEAIKLAISDLSPNTTSSNVIIVFTGGIDTCQDYSPIENLETYLRRLGDELEFEFNLIGVNIEAEKNGKN